MPEYRPGTVHTSHRRGVSTGPLRTTMGARARDSAGKGGGSRRTGCVGPLFPESVSSAKPCTTVPRIASEARGPDTTTTTCAGV